MRCEKTSGGEKLSIQFSIAECSNATAGQPGCGPKKSVSRSTRGRCCSKPKFRAAARRSPLHNQADSDSLLVSMMPLVKRVASQFRGRLPSHVELDDLVSAGTLGLMDAVRRFDPGKGVTFESYARYRIRGAILDSLREEDPASRDMRRKIKKIETVCQNLEFHLGRPASDGEMAEAMGLSLERWHAMVSTLRQLGFEGAGGKMFQEIRQRVDEESVPAANADNPFDLCYRSEQKDILGLALRSLTERERSIMTFYYQQCLSMKQIGARLGIDESRVSQLHSGAVIKLRARVSSILRGPARGMCGDSGRARAVALHA